MPFQSADAHLTRGLFDAATDGMVLTDETGRLLAGNPAACELFGARCEELIGQSLADFLDPKDAWSASLPAGRARVCNVRRADGGRSEVEVRAKPNVRPGLHLAVLRDLTARRAAEDVLQRTEAQLHQAQKMEAIGLLAGGVAHDFNNMLTVITSYGAMLRDSFAANDPRRDDLNEMLQAAERAADLTRQLLAFSRKQVLQPRLLDLNETLAGMTKMLGRLIGEDVELTLVPGEALGTVYADAGQIEQVVMNLAVNARDAMPAGGKLTIETANVQLDDAYAAEHVGVKPGEYVMIAVADDGVGMDAETRARVFEPFFTTKGPGKGTGLGLSTVFGIVQQSEGSVWVYSEPGRGTIFRVYLPRVYDAVARVAPPSSPPVARGCETVLVVEDDDRVRRVVCAILKRAGYRVLDASSPSAALTTAVQGEERIDVLLTDMVMPGMSGEQLAERFAVIRPQVPVVYMSGYTDNALVHAGALRGGRSFVQKPVTPDVLTRKIRQALDGPF